MVYSLHKHELRAGINTAQYEREVAEAIAQIKIPGLLHAYHLKGFKGARDGRYGVLWIFANEAAITKF